MQVVDLNQSTILIFNLIFLFYPPRGDMDIITYLIFFSSSLLVLKHELFLLTRIIHEFL